VLLADLVTTSAAIASTRARTKKVAALAELLRRLAPDEVEVAVAYLSGDQRQGRVGIGWASLGALGAGARDDAPSLTVLDVDAAIDAVARASGAGSQSARRDVLARLFERATPDEADFLRRLLLGDLRQGALEGVMCDAVARAAGVDGAVVRRAVMLAGDLPHAAALALAGGEETLRAVGLDVLRPIKPMLASPAASVADAVAALGRVSVGWKLDGARIQAHRAGGEVRLYTRNLNDVTTRLPGVVDVVRSLPCDAVVLDGEVLGVGDDGATPDAFQDTMSRFGRRAPQRRGADENGVAGAQLGVWFFDCLHVDGDDLLDAPLRERQAHLDRLASTWRVPALVTADADDAGAFLDGALAAGHEGVVVKDIESAYEAGRRGAAWRKVKPVRTLDLVVLGAEWGHGRRRGWLSNLYLGARASEAGDGFVMVGKTFKGLTDALLTWQTEQLLARETHREGIAVFVRPELVVEIALDGVQTSTRYPGGVALRFARVRRYRDDKGPGEADTIDAVRALLHHPG
jgi:DNA ligase-1